MEKIDRIGQLLVKEGLIGDEQLREALEKQQTSYGNKPIGEVLIALEMITESDFLRILAKQFKTKYVTTDKLAEFSIPKGLMNLVPLAIAEKHQVLPIIYNKQEKSLSIVTTDPLNYQAFDEIKFASGISNIRTLVATPSAIKAGIDKYYKGNDRAFEKDGINPEGESSQESDTMPMTGSSGEIVVDTDSDSGDGQIEIEMDGPSGYEKTSFDPSAPSQKSKEPEDDRIDISLPSSSKKESSVFLGGMEEFPGDNNSARGKAQTPPAHEIDLGSGDDDSMGGAPADDDASKEKPKEKSKDSKKYKKKKMLLVEPDDKMRKNLPNMFKYDKFQLETQAVPDKESAFAFINQDEYDVVVIKETAAGEGNEFEDKLKEISPNTEVHVIKDYGSAIIGETKFQYKLIESFFETLDVIISLMEMDREGYQGHTHQVAKYSKLLAQKLGLARQEINEVVMAAYAHDLGKKGRTHLTLLHFLTKEIPKDAIKDAIEIPIRLLNAANLPMNIQRVIGNSFERMDGKGYPGMLSGEDIPITSRILSVVDALSFLTAEGFDGSKYSIPDALSYIQKHSGGMFDKSVIDTLTQVVKDDLFVGKMDSAKEHILVVDDEADLTTLLELKFVNAGYRVSVARNGEEALEKAKAVPPDFILVEADLPKINGFKFIEGLAKTDSAGVPFIFLTKTDDPKLMTKAFDLGAEDVIKKPVRTEVLYAKVNRIMERIKKSKKAAAPAGQAAGVSGNLSEMSLPDIVQILGAGRRTCLLTINHSGEKAEIFLEEGRIVNAAYNKEQGEEAFYKIIGWEAGTFGINPEVTITERLINKNNDSLMLEGFRRLDEGANRQEEEVPAESGDFF